METAADLVLATSPNKYSLPSDFLAEIDDRPIYLTDSEGTVSFLEKKFGDELVDKKDYEGTPKYYFLSEGLYLHAYPYLSSPTDSTVTFPYFASQPQIDVSSLENTDFKWYNKAPFMLIGQAGMVLAEQVLKDPEISQGFAKTFAQSFNQLIAQNVEHEQRMLDLSQQKLRRRR